MSAEPLALVVDDSPEQADLLRRFLERAGCRVVTACSAEQAAAVLPKPFTGEQVRELGARVVGCG